jgi:hypothetical protein
MSYYVQIYLSAAVDRIKPGLLIERTGARKTGEDVETDNSRQSILIERWRRSSTLVRSPQIETARG